jgi:hypothetical protein
MFMASLILVLSSISLSFGVSSVLTANNTSLMYRYFRTSSGGNRERLKAMLKLFADSHKLESFLAIDECCEKLKKKGWRYIWAGAILFLPSVGYVISRFVL